MTPSETIRHSLATPEFFRVATAVGYTDKAAAFLYHWLHSYEKGCTPVPNANGRLVDPKAVAMVLFGVSAAVAVNQRSDGIDLEAFEELLGKLVEMVGELTSEELRIAWVEFLTNQAVFASDVVKRFPIRKGTQP